MKFLWPNMLWFLICLPLLVMLYFWLMNRRKKASLVYSDLKLIKQAMQQQTNWRRHVPPILFLLSLALMLIALGRPSAIVSLPSQHETIIMAMDVSGSMRAKDVEPDRMTASQIAAKQFVKDTPLDTRIGLVTFAGSAALVQPPTRTKEDLIAAIDRFQFQRGTAVGSGLLVGLKTIFPDMEIDLRAPTARSRNGSNNSGTSSGGGLPSSANVGDGKGTEKTPPKPVPPGSNKTAVIVLLTDGATTTGADPIEAAKEAANRGIKVFTVGFGTQNGEIIGLEGWSMRVRLDEDALKQIAAITQGEYFYAGSALDLKKVYETLSSRLVMEKKETEITAFFTAAAALLATLAAGLSVLWFRRVL
jgi:Ca-activated chloride channel homolog